MTIANVPGLDKSKPFLRHKDFVTGEVTYEQNGKKYTEAGYIVIERKPIKYPCPKCDFGTDNASHLIAHASKVHQASDLTTECYKLYIQNIDRDLPWNEGIDWQTLKITKTTAQVAIDEQDKKNLEQKPEAAAAEKEPATHKCPHCTFVGKSQPSLAGHMKKHAPDNTASKS